MCRQKEGLFLLQWGGTKGQVTPVLHTLSYMVALHEVTNMAVPKKQQNGTISTPGESVGKALY